MHNAVDRNCHSFPIVIVYVSALISMYMYPLGQSLTRPNVPYFNIIFNIWTKSMVMLL